MAVIETFIDGLKQGKFSKEFFEVGLTSTQEKLPGGLPQNIFESLVDIFISTNINAAYLTKLVRCLVPEGRIENQVIDRILTWILSKHNTKPVSVISALLQWLTGAVEFGIVDKSYVDSYYELIWGMLYNNKLERHTCHLLHILTRPEDVYRGRVQFLLQLHECNGKGAHTMALLSLFKSYKPEYIPETVQLRNHQRAFKPFPNSLEVHFKLAQDRLLLREITVKKNKFDCSWSRPFMREKQKILPDVSYAHMERDSFHEKRKKVIQYLDKKTLIMNQEHLEMPSRVLSLLLSEGGLHLLATHNHNVHVRFSYVVYHTLHNVFIEKRVKYPKEECSYFLSQLCNLEDYLQQGIPVVTRFLNEYICTWDGFEYRELIYRLLGRISFKSFEELQVYILNYLNTLFITGSLDEKYLIIRTLKTLIMNVHNCKQRESANIGRGGILTFLGNNPLENVDINTFLPQLVQFVDTMFQRGFQTTKGHPLLLHACIDFHAVVAEIENPRISMSILPRSCLYRCLLGRSTSMLSQACKLFNRYNEIHAELKGTGELDTHVIQVLSEYAYDMCNCLVRDKALSKAHKGYIFENVPKDFLFNGDESFSITTSVTMNSLMLFLRKNDEESLETLLFTFRTLFKDLLEFLDLLQKKAS